MDALREVQTATTEAASKARLAIRQRLHEFTEQILAAVKDDDGSNAAAIRVAQVAEALANVSNTLNETRESRQWATIAEQWRTTAILRGQANPVDGRRD